VSSFKKEIEMTLGQIANVPVPQRKHSLIRKLTAQGFTLIEIIVILAVISILVAIMTPTVLKYIEEAQLNRASEDVKVINAALNDIIKDTGKYPGSELNGSATFLVGPGTLPTTGAATWATTSNDELLLDHLIVNNPGDGTPYVSTGRRRWRGPYVQVLNEDPWGNAYQVNASTLIGGNTGQTWVISAGPNGEYETATTATTISAGSDDIGIRIK
jgi:prepilin-type N-terminal cleavage/methylation domain-containing protein